MKRNEPKETKERVDKNGNIKTTAIIALPPAVNKKVKAKAKKQVRSVSNYISNLLIELNPEEEQQ
jgi:hypothetical protein